MQEEEGISAAENQLGAAPITVRMPLVSASGNGFDEITAERDSGCGAQTANRWPRQETMALLKIRSDMDRAFQEATLKAPLWEEVSRKLSEEGYQRNAKKCKEKFENVFKYYKRTKEARSGKSYRFFTQLETLLASPTAAAAAGELPPPAATTMVNVEPTPSHQITVPSPPVTVAHPITTLPPTNPPSSSSKTSSFSNTEWEEEEEEEEQEGESSRKRKRKAESVKMTSFFEGLIQKLMDQQEKMLQRFSEAIERREQNRMIREEAWRRQEKSRLSREHELAAQERAAASSRDKAIISFLEKLTGQKIPFPAPPPIITVEETPVSSSPQVEIAEQSIKETALVVSRAEQVLSSRWPKAEVLALIKLRSGMENRYQESVPKGPLWEEISAGMISLGYNRSSKRCKEKWENINKYFKKVKESNKSRPEDAKTCPYFHQLDALYRNKLIGGSFSTDDQLAIISPSMDSSKQEGDRLGFFEQGSSSVSAVKKPEDTVKKKMEQGIVEFESESSFQFRIQYVMPPLVLCGTTLQNNFEFSSMVR